MALVVGDGGHEQPPDREDREQEPEESRESQVLCHGRPPGRDFEVPERPNLGRAPRGCPPAADEPRRFRPARVRHIVWIGRDPGPLHRRPARREARRHRRLPHPVRDPGRPHAPRDGARRAVPRAAARPRSCPGSTWRWPASPSRSPRAVARAGDARAAARPVRPPRRLRGGHLRCSGWPGSSTHPWALRALYVWTGSLGTLAALQFWMVLGELLHRHPGQAAVQDRRRRARCWARWRARGWRA